jgi:hypothetical protein
MQYGTITRLRMSWGCSQGLALIIRLDLAISLHSFKLKPSFMSMLSKVYPVISLDLDFTQLPGLLLLPGPLSVTYNPPGFLRWIPCHRSCCESPPLKSGGLIWAVVGLLYPEAHCSGKSHPNLANSSIFLSPHGNGAMLGVALNLWEKAGTLRKV